MLFLGIDLGSSSIKLSVFNAVTGQIACSLTVPENEMAINAPYFGWAEQEPEKWWEYIKDGIKALPAKGVDVKAIKGIGIAYQMHGLVLTDENLNPVRPSIIWCDSRAAETGDAIYQQMGTEACQQTLLGSPGNFTAAKLKWVKDNEPDTYARARYMMLPGDYIAAMLTGRAQTTASGLSEAALWNFKEARPATEVLDAMQITHDFIPEVVPTFGHQAVISTAIAAELGLAEGTEVTYRAGDQPNNALSLSVLNPGEIATTAGTSAVIYSVTQANAFDADNRVNTFLHVNNTPEQHSNGVLLCINGSGILYQWLRKTLSLGSSAPISYELLNAEAAKAEPGSKGLRFYPFGNGVERIFGNKPAFSGIQNLNFNIHQSPELVRAACEGIVFAMNYGFDIMKDINAGGTLVKAGNANLFLSPVFREIFVNTTQTTLELYNTGGAEGAARGAAYGFGYFKTAQEAFANLERLQTITPTPELTKLYAEIYQNWKNNL
ncbi:carbohydrate kinase [Flavobacterium akiainvivens]|uniref:Carbohydrate kinase n=2 Tax=Flavobacterium akiainvivens TaxID=1202724 RepID=A0A0M9VK72_9FLAO|nr:FGGY family carbohydrate kinase [Flavobacterium akiainvivens]KOS08232.1 carbohydrate kinase [Flavobacterium akiainvivens]SFQ36332.1 xylulokinase [Flavobacterium akiainvivens]